MLNSTRYFVTGIGTGVGKTVCSAILCEALGADYWKPLQAGDLSNSDTITVKSLISNKQCEFHNEAYQLPYAMSPHASAKKAGVEINTDLIQVPQTSNKLIIEGAGGLMVPVTDTKLYINLIKQFNAEVILVSQNYLGSINHTLLSAESLFYRGIPVAGIVFNGDENIETESVILNMTGLRMLGRIPTTKTITKAFIKKTAASFNKS